MCRFLLINRPLLLLGDDISNMIFSGVNFEATRIDKAHGMDLDAMLDGFGWLRLHKGNILAPVLPR